ncbi:helix-turn-helix transcriptional regulator [Crocosphaera chwakensis]|uniref:WCX domain-containing protein n=1 Tax=Crocosphaera chwakensis CCY0110 TaxID=391612 RepID=A3IZE9_9CHRO|nr:WYL domain-containing protein [Crocosphaera chwakensis]EAZ88137.1 hypothetical protein CY0110_30975 [Crocosphaera chwakensis CCY0110]
MKKKSKSHPYAELKAFERLMLLIATLVEYPGVGYLKKENKEDKENHHDALEEVQWYLRQVAQSLNIKLPEEYPALPTIRKDLQTLKKYNILEQRMYRWGYYLGTGVMSYDELRIAVNALKSQAFRQGEPKIRKIYSKLEERLKGTEALNIQNLFYPIRQHLNRVINYTDPEEMIEKNKGSKTLFRHIDKIELAIIKGEKIEISRKVDPYKGDRVGFQQIWPLQLIFHDIAWYLLYERCNDNHLAIGRINRLADYCKVLEKKGRGVEAQRESLTKGYKLLDQGWGLKLGDAEEQQKELKGELELITAKVRFFHPVSQFIEEGELRHPTQKLTRSKSKLKNNKPEYIDYAVKLPPRSIDEFNLWVNRHGASAQVLEPENLVKQHRESALKLVARYQQNH